MFRKLIALGLIGGAIAALIKRRSGSDSTDSAPSPAPSTTVDPASDEPAAPTEQQADDQSADDLAEVRSGQTEQTIEAPIAGVGDDDTSVIPDTSDDDPLVRQQESAAAADAGSIGGDPDTVTADVDPEMRPVVEGSGDAPETFETTDEQGR
jgi:hypothetical protein